MVSELTVDFGDRTRTLSAALVRSWCRCKDCGVTATGHRWASLTDIPNGVTAESSDQTGNMLTVSWSDGHQSSIDLSSIHPNTDPGAAEPTLPMAPPPQLAFDDVVNTDAALLSALEALALTGAVHLRGAPTEAGAIVTLAQRFGPIRVTSYGQVQVFITSAKAKTAAHTGNPQHPHTDEPFRYSPPGFLFFHMVESAAEGEGTSLLVDGFAAAEQLRAENPDAFHVLASTGVEFHRVHEGEVRFSTRSRVVTVGSDGRVEAVRLNIRCLAPLDPTIENVDDVLAAIAALSEIIERPENQRRLHLQSGDLLVFDNHRIMHGRTGFHDDRPRHLESCNVDRDEVHSKHRLLAHQAGKRAPALATGPTT